MLPLVPDAPSVTAFLARTLAEGAFHCGEIQVTPAGSGGVELRHWRDGALAEAGLEFSDDPAAAAEIARYTDAGEYRPLKTAPNLRRGWRLVVAGAGGLRLALDLFYPGRLGAYVAFGHQRLEVTNFRETLGRQSGMYRITQKLTAEQADALVGRFCRSDGGCLRTILWRLDSDGTLASTRLPAAKYEPVVEQGGMGGADSRWLPLLCQEACNLLVAEARQVVKGEV